MKLKIALSKYNVDGSMATIENADGFDINVCGGVSVNAKNACLGAAKALRDAAARFELLALEDAPYQAKVHARINATKLPETKAQARQQEVVSRDTTQQEV